MNKRNPHKFTHHESTHIFPENSIVIMDYMTNPPFNENTICSIISTFLGSIGGSSPKNLYQLPDLTPALSNSV